MAAADRLLDAAKSAGVLLTVISQHRFDAGPVSLYTHVVIKDNLNELLTGRLCAGIEQKVPVSGL